MRAGRQAGDSPAPTQSNEFEISTTPGHRPAVAGEQDRDCFSSTTSDFTRGVLKQEIELDN
jgi:hypothetical protein